jgi:dihydroxy-acid dehydratase
MGGLALLKTGDRVRIDLRKGTVNALISDEEMAERRAALAAAGGFPIPPARRRGRKSSAIWSAR